MKMNANGNQSVKRVVSKKQIITDLRDLGIKEGDHVAVTLSLKGVGYLKGGPKEFIEALLDVIGPYGTLMMNAFTYVFPVSSIPNNHVFDYKLSPSYAGIVPETLRKMNGTIRSRHPAYSVVAIGKNAEYLTEGHDCESEPLLPYSRLAKINGKYLCIGIGDRLVGIRHEAQRRAGLSSVVPIRYGVKYKTDQNQVKLYVTPFFGCIKNLPNLVPGIKKMGILTAGTVGMAQAYIASAEELIECMTLQLKESPELNLCGDGLCLWCRELERRLNLFDKIHHPKFYQKNVFAIRLVALVNRVRLSLFSFLVFSNKNMLDEFAKPTIIQLASDSLHCLYLTVRSKFT